MKRLDEIEARTNAATEGPWVTYTVTPHMGSEVLTAPREGEDYGDYVVPEYIDMDNAEFIAHARTDVPALLDALEKVLRLHPRVVVLHADPEFGRMEDDAICGACIVNHEPADWPCPTVEAITTALEGETND